jgi:hypothetical protein
LLEREEVECSLRDLKLESLKKTAAPQSESEFFFISAERYQELNLFQFGENTIFHSLCPQQSE